MDLSIIIPTLNEKDNLVLLIPKVKQVISSLTNCYEIIIVDGGSVDDTVETASSFGAKVIIHPQKGYGNALKLGFKYAKGKFILTLDADLSHNPDFIEHMWERRHEAEIIIGSRYIPGGEANMPVIRKIFSVILNFSFSKILSLPIKDFSSGFRLYKKQILEEIPLEGTQFEILEEVLIKCYAQGYQILETPLIYVPRKSGQSKAKLFKFGIVLLKTLVKMWCLRNSIDSADYDERAYISKIPLQRYWQRKRHAIITQNADSKKLTFDIGCGSSRILKTLNRAVGIDIGISRLRYMRRYHVPLVNASVFALPFKNSSVESAICSQVIEHVIILPKNWTKV